jgi:nucleoside-diphosphate-sugar epimerase
MSERPAATPGAGRVLVTGATGAVGGECFRQLLAAGFDVYGVSSNGGPHPRQFAWRMGSQYPPDELAGPWAAVVHTAANTRWDLSQEQATRANLDSVYALLSLLDPDTHLIHMSTAYVVGRERVPDPREPEDFHNTYEWSKAAGERLLAEAHPRTDVLRFPLVAGRRADGYVERFSGFFWIPSGLCSGAVPAVVGRPDAVVDIVSTDDIAGLVLRLLAGPPPQARRLSVLGRGAEAPRLGAVLDRVLDALDAWRQERRLDPLPRPPYITPEKWNRFYLPFAKEHFSRGHLIRVRAYQVFEPYLSRSGTFEVTEQVPDVMDVVFMTTTHWAECNPRLATMSPRPWTSQRPGARTVPAATGS